MPHSVLYYVSGHGYGHARRSAEVIRALRAAAPDVNMYVRTSAPPSIFRGLTAAPVMPGEIDAPVVEHDSLSIDWAATLAGTADLLRRRRSAVAREVHAVEGLGPSLLVADVPFLAADVAAALGVPCVGLSNFTWDWIFAPHRAAHPDAAAVVRGVRASYGRMAALLRLPFGHETDVFPQVIPVPLVARRGTADPEDVLRRLGVDPSDRRPRVLVGMRGGIDPQTLERAKASAPGFCFLRADPEDFGLDFSDLMAASDVVVSKLGYGTIADAIANGTRLVWPPRSGFREDDVTAAEAPRFLRMRGMSPEQLHAGEWRESLERALELPPPPQRMPTDGAAACAAVLSQWLNR
jgi:L-arabinokinase